MNLEAIIANLQAKAAALSGIVEAPAEPPEQPNQFPFAITYLRNGRLEFITLDMDIFIHTVVTEIHIARQLLPAAIKLAIPYGNTFPLAVRADPRLGGTVSTILEMRYQFGELNYGKVKTIGYAFELDFKVNF